MISPPPALNCLSSAQSESHLTSNLLVVPNPQPFEYILMNILSCPLPSSCHNIQVTIPIAPTMYCLYHCVTFALSNSNFFPIQYWHLTNISIIFKIFFYKINVYTYKHMSHVYTYKWQGRFLSLLTNKFGIIST